ncbi:FAD/NAD(P)-dependent oxidoreductase [Actinoallomurus soli]|uniref:FAD/NAD(P)-dependent oxidoreductase n=1 Tax=Actinoallomurus soli TaxID=2952535 RepID=UPI0020935569|nr:NAD(P)/FAD-dependent oxidoreductase [Actinoallomurus soli]MCO5967663.1 FAD-dependent oxidoreductase [Actinoallomurus soli]
MRDLVVIGAGPAGLAAAVAAATAGLDVALVDAGRRPGGQYYRHHAAETGRLHHDWDAFVRLRGALDRLTYLPGHRVWHVEDGFTVHALTGDRDERPVRIGARALVVATGAHDRSLPFPGWDLPGVLTAGGAQALLKGDRVTAGERIVVAGTGPFLLPVATGLAGAGATIAGVFEANRPYGFARHVARHPDKAREGAGYAALLARHRIPYRTGHAVVAAHGDDRVEAVTVARLDRDWAPVRERVIACDTVAVGHGFTPQLELPLQLGCATRMDADGSLVVAVDVAQRTSVPGVYAAGETTGVGGAQLSLVEGELAGLAVAEAAGGVAPDPAGVQRLLARRRRLRAFAAAMHAAYPVRPGWMDRLRDDTLVCRCEEVTCGRLAEAAELGATGPRSAKLLSRAGMGRCQGRVCGYATAWLTTGVCGRIPGPEDLLGTARRPIAQPVRLRDLAGEPENPRDENHPINPA